MRKQKRGIAMSFNWIFALIAGAVILFLAIYGVNRFIRTSEQTIYTESSAKLATILESFETGLASGKSDSINFKKPIRTFYECDEFNNRPFGRQTLAFSEQTIGNKWGEKGGEVSIKNKYVFAENILEGKTLNVFSKPFSLGFKVADLIIISSENYCFYQAPEDIKNEMQSLNPNIIFTENPQDLQENCSDKIQVCWGGRDCDIRITENRVIKRGEEMYYTGDLIYAAIFSSPEIYKCNLKRLKNKFNELALIYQTKSNIIQKYGCGSSISSNLEIIKNKNIESSREALIWETYSENLNLINQNADRGCKLW